MKKKIKTSLKWFFNSFIWLGVIIFAIDIISKNLVVYYHNTGALSEQGAEIIPNFLRINYTINNHFVFGLDLLKNDVATRVVFVVIALLISFLIILYLIKKWDKVNKYYRACLMMIVAGAIGNSIDRIFYSTNYLNFFKDGRYISGVVDFIDFYKIWGFHFNIADCGVVIGAIMLVVYMIVIEIIDAYKKYKKEKKLENSQDKILSKTEQEKNQFIKKKDNNNE